MLCIIYDSNNNELIDYISFETKATLRTELENIYDKCMSKHIYEIGIGVINISEAVEDLIVDFIQDSESCRVEDDLVWFVGEYIRNKYPDYHWYADITEYSDRDEFIEQASSWAIIKRTL